MKRETNNEMDLLLRRLGRSAADSADRDHLDADELSSYAENALPTVARARYTEHLAECASCRKLVAQLSSSAAVVSAAETVKVSQPSAFKKFLASLFAPIVLRYAVPALGLIVVAAIGCTVLRRNEQRESVAQLKEPEAKAPIVQPAESPASGRVDDNRGFFGTPEAAPANRGARPAEQSKETQPAPAPSQTPVAAARVDAQANEAAPVRQAEQPPPAPKPAELKPGTATDEVQKKPETEARKEEVTNRSARDLPKAAVADASKGDDRSFSAARAPARAAGALAGAKRREAEEKDTETRAAGGRRFRREGGVWIDTAYDSSRSTVNVARGSEQYRALVADEPVIKSIADQLDGEIIVVWKGRAYRIQ